MKKNFKFMLVALLAMLSTNSFATQMHRLVDNVVYGYDNTVTDECKGTAAKPFFAVVEGVKGTNLTTVTIGQTVTFKNDLGDDVVLQITGFGENWTAENATLGTKDITETLTTLSVDFTKWAAEGFNFSALTALTSLTLIDQEVTETLQPSLTNIANLILPASLETLNVEKLYGVKDIPAETFKASKLTSITLPANLLRIEYSAFENAADLTAVAFPKGVQYVGNYAFSGCASLASATFAEEAAITWIGAAAFKGTALTSFTVPATVTEIRNNAFENAAALTTVTFNEALKDLGKEAFKGSGITAADLSGTAVTQIMNGTFKNSQLASITFPDALTGIEAEAFENAPLTAVAIPAATKYVGNFAFNGCESLATVTFAEEAAITWIGASAFKGTAALTAIEIPETVTEIKNNAFEGSAIAELIAPSVTTIGEAIFGVFTAAEPNTTLTNVELGAVNIPARYFANFTALTTFTWGDTDLTHTVGANAFEGCTALTDFNYALADDFEVNFDQQVNIDPNAFIGCQQYVMIHTSMNYAMEYYIENNFSEPLNAKFDAELPEPEAPLTIPETVKDQTGEMYYQKFNVPRNSEVLGYQIDADDVAGVYSIYVDEGIAYFQSLRKRDGYYNVLRGECVIVKTDEAKEVEITPINMLTSRAYAPQNSVLVDEVMCLSAGTEEEPYSVTLAQFQAQGEDIIYDSNWTAGHYDYQPAYPSNDLFIYRLTNTATSGFGFTKFTGSTLKGGQFFIISDYQAPAGARLQSIWLDEDGNVENDGLTGIQRIQNNNEDGAIYNLQGVRVNNAKKGLYIQNGKKYVVK